MVALEYAVAALVAVAVSSALLWQRHRRGPFGERKATLWWAGVVALDAGVALLCFLGVFGLQGADLEGTSGALRAAGIGALGPLGLRSPVGKRRIRGKSEAVGPTFVYDAVRVRMEQELEERMTRLRRRDRERRTAALEQQGWDASSFANRLDEHLTDLSDGTTWDPQDLQRLRTRCKATETVPFEDRMKALLDIAIRERFTGLLEDCSERGPRKSDLRERERWRAPSR